MTAPLLAIQYPAEGAIAVMFGAALPKRAPSPELAYVYFNAMLDPKAMAGLAGASFLRSGQRQGSPFARAESEIDFHGGGAAALKFPDLEHVAKNTARMAGVVEQEHRPLSRDMPAQR